MSRRFEDLVQLQARLLDPDGCPWDREQSHDSLRTYLLEETYEVLETLEERDFRKLPEELGDLLLQIVFHAELARRAGHFDIGDVIGNIYAKMVRRHPHVFGDTQAKDARQVLQNWEQLKSEERRAIGGGESEDSLLDGIPRTLPATLEAYQMTRRAARVGFDWDTLPDLLAKVQEELEEVRKAHTDSAPDHLAEEVGDLLFVAVNVARFLEIDPEIALRKANHKFRRRFVAMEREAARRGSRLAETPREEMEALWEQAKTGKPDERPANEGKQTG